MWTPTGLSQPPNLLWIRDPQITKEHRDMQPKQNCTGRPPKCWQTQKKKKKRSPAVHQPHSFKLTPLTGACTHTHTLTLKNTNPQIHTHMKTSKLTTLPQIHRARQLLKLCVSAGSPTRERATPRNTGRFYLEITVGRVSKRLKPTTSKQA